MVDCMMFTLAELHIIYMFREHIIAFYVLCYMNLDVCARLLLRTTVIGTFPYEGNHVSPCSAVPVRWQLELIHP